MHIINGDLIQWLICYPRKPVSCEVTTTVLTPTRITQRDQKSKRHRGLSRKRYSHYKFKKHNNVTSKENDHLDEVFRTGSRWKTKMKFFQLYY